MRLVRLLLALPVLCVLLLGACGGNEESEPERGDDPFPLAVGNRWETQIVRSVSAGPVLRRPGSREVMRTFMLDGELTWEMKLGDELPRYEWVQRTATEVVRLPTPQDSAVDRAVGPRVILKLPLQVGQQWVQVDRSVVTGEYVDAGGVPLPTRVLATAQVLAQESITVPAGTYDDAWKVVYSEHQETVFAAEGDSAWSNVDTTVWLVPGIGVVNIGVSALNYTSLRSDYSNERLLSLRLQPAAP